MDRDTTAGTCGCWAKPPDPRDEPDTDDPIIVFCPLHAAAPALLDALKEAAAGLDLAAAWAPDEWPVWSRLMLHRAAYVRAAIRTAEGG